MLILTFIKFTHIIAKALINPRPRSFLPLSKILMKNFVPSETFHRYSSVRKLTGYDSNMVSMGPRIFLFATRPTLGPIQIPSQCVPVYRGPFPRDTFLNGKHVKFFKLLNYIKYALTRVLRTARWRVCNLQLSSKFITRGERISQYFTASRTEFSVRLFVLVVQYLQNTPPFLVRFSILGTGRLEQEFSAA